MNSKSSNVRLFWPRILKHLFCRGNKNAEEGSGLIEFALCALLMLITMFGILEIGRAVYAYHCVSHVAREATRWAAVRGSSCSGLSGGCPATAANVRNYVLSITPGGIDQGQLTVNTTWSPNNDPGGTVNVNVQYNFDFAVGLVGTSPIHMHSTSQYVISQ